MKWLAFLLFTLPLLAQPESPEIFGHIGYGTAQGDEGSEGSGLVIGGAVHLPFAAHWAFDFDAQQIRTRRETGGPFSFGTNRTLLSPALVYRRGTEKLYWFGGGGIGARLETTFTEGPNGRFSSSRQGWTIPLRTGIVAAISKRLLLRAEVFAVTSFLVPDAGVQIGIGYRF